MRGESSVARSSVRCPALTGRFVLTLPEELESRADDAIMAGPIASEDFPDALRGSIWQAGLEAIAGLVQADHRSACAGMAFGAVQHRFLPCWTHARDPADST